MAKSWQAWVMGCLVGCGSTVAAGPVSAATVAQVLQFQPRQHGVVCSTPTTEEQRGCEVKVVAGTRQGSSGYLLLDARKQPLRRFFDSNGDKRIDVWSYYKDGLEVYRETDTNYNEKADQYRWFNSGGMRWGLDLNEDGRIDAWKMISAEEVGQEVFEAAVHRDLARLQALFITDAEIKALHLSTNRAEQVRSILRDAARKFQANLDKMPNLNDKAQFKHVETSTPQCLPGDSGDDDVIMFPSRAILFVGPDQKHDWLHTGEMLKVGLAWRLLDVPSQQENISTPNPDRDPLPQTTNPEAQKTLDVIAEMDKNPPTPPSSPSPHPETVRYNLQRAQLVEKVLPKLQAGADRDNWIKQLFDNYSTAAQYSGDKDKRAITRLKDLCDQAAKDPSAAKLVPYGKYRWLWAEFAPKMTGSDPRLEQEKWLDQLARFVQTYPRAEDTPDALYQLAMTCEFAGRDEESKRWYHQLASNFPQHHLAAKAAGAKRRLELVGQPIELQGPTIDGSSFDIARLKGKVVAVYYWASYCKDLASDFNRLKQLYSAHSSTGLELVLISLDDQKETAFRAMQGVPGTHLYEPGASATGEGGGLNSPLATQYGIQGLPTLFLVGRDGKVLNRTLQITDLEEAVKKAL